MSEFYFSYRCMAPDGTDATYRDDAPRLLLYACGKFVDSPDVCLLVPRVLREKYETMFLYHTADGVDFPDVATAKPCAAVSLSSDTSPLYAYLRFGERETGGGVGAAAFLRSGESTPSSAHTYRFAYDLSHKSLVSYRIAEQKDGITVQAVYPYLHEDIPLRVLCGKGAKPLTFGAAYDPENAMRQGNDLVTLTLRNRNRPADATEPRRIAAADTSSRDFRLTFARPEDADRILLADESEETLEDRKLRKFDRDRRRASRTPRKATSIAVFGASGAGKTTYLSSLGCCQWANELEAVYLTRMASAWGKLSARKRQIVVGAPLKYIRLMSLPSPTAAEEANKDMCVSVSLCGEKRQGNTPRQLKLYDSSGASFAGGQLPQEWESRDGYMLCIDISEGAKAAADALMSALDLMSICNTKKEAMYDKPVAVVLMKLDRLLRDRLPRGNDIEGCLDGNCHVTQEDTRDLYPADGVYEGSALSRHIDAADYELAHFLCAGGESSREKYEIIKRRYPNLKLFACSALGYADICDGAGALLCPPSPLRTELPLVWLAYRVGVIRR